MGSISLYKGERIFLVSLIDRFKSLIIGLMR